MLESNLSGLIVPAVLWCLIAMSVVTWALFVIKVLQLSRIHVANNHFKKAFWAATSIEQGQQIASQKAGSMVAIAQAGFAAISKSDITGSMPVLSEKIDRRDRLERALQREIRRQRRVQESWVVVLASFGSTAPFVGLFGTVWGIMQALVNISNTGSTGLDAVAGPVGHALVATGMGIAVAVPAVLIYNFLIRRLNTSTDAMKNFAHDFYNLCQQTDFTAPEPSNESAQQQVD